MDETLLAVMKASIARTDELNATQVAELEKAIACLHDLLRVPAGAAMKLLEINAPRDATDSAVIEDVVRRASKAMEYLEPPRQ